MGLEKFEKGINSRGEIIQTDRWKDRLSGKNIELKMRNRYNDIFQ